MRNIKVFWLLSITCLALACVQRTGALDSHAKAAAIAEIQSLSDTAWFNHVRPQINLNEGRKLLLSALAKAQAVGDNYWIGDCNSQLSTIARLQSDLPLAIYYGKEALHHRTLLDSALLIGRSQNNIGIIYKNFEKYDSARFYFEGAIQNYQLADYPKGINRTRINIAETYNKQNRYQEALQAAWQVKDIGNLDLYTALANIHLEIGTLDSAGFYFKRILTRLLELESPDVSRLIKVYHNLSGWAIQQNLYEIAKGYALEGHKLAKSEDKEVDGENLHHLGIIYTELNQLEIAYGYLIEGEAYFQENKDTASLAKLYHNLAFLEKERKNHTEAIEHLQKCLLLVSNSRDLLTEIKTHGMLAEVYDSLKNYEDANAARLSIIQIQDSVFELSQNAKDFELLANKEKQLRITNERNELTIWLLSVAILAGLIFLAMIFMRIRSQRKFSKLQNEFLLAKEDGRQTERNRIADRLHDDVGALITIAAEQLNTISDNKALGMTIKQIASEVRNISKDLKSAVLTKLGLKDAIQDLVDKLKNDSSPTVEAHFTILSEARLDTIYEVQAYAITKELLNNALKHAEANNINIYLTVDSKQCQIMVEDDGKGIPDQMILNPSGQGLKSIQNRVRKLDGKCEFDANPKSGSTITVTIPIKA